MTKKFVRRLETNDIVEKGNIFRDGDDGFKITIIERIEELHGTVYVTFRARKMTNKERDNFFEFLRDLEEKRKGDAS
ncbi:hypothetical protein [Shimazuella kribbensis]|uniref:hypothetical protein n=1 Tax=Shimazuella kribbensis TaxID=139808 RepID=UPI0003F6CB2E|nr:hypothetical protein [Shimazuella kribbensis]